jgi:BlaI family transcriptional regulator, penicillinase repressor
MKPIKISDSEWQVMNIVWAKSPLPSSEIVETLTHQKGWHPRTIRTLLDRLVRKRALRAVPEGKRYLYEPRISVEEGIRQESQSFLDRVFGGEPATMLLHLVGEAKLSREEIQQLKSILTEKEK